MAFVKRYDAMVPRLRAEESFAMVERVGCGTGSFDAGVQRKIKAGWTRDMDAGQVKLPQPRPTDRDLASVGIGVRRVKRASA